MNIKRIISACFRKVLSILTFVVPKKKGMLLFVPLHDTNKITGNIKALFDYGIINEPNFELIYWVQNQKVYDFLNAKNYKVIKGSVKLVWYSLRAEHIIIDAATTVFNFKNVSIIQLWHGAGIKNVGFANDNTDLYTRNLLKNHYNTYRFVTAISEYDKEMHNAKFEIRTALVTGLARNDAFFQDKSVTDSVKTKYGLQNYSTIITYAPTFRDHFTKPNFTENFWNTFNEYLKNKNQIFVIKKHPWDAFFKVPENLSNVVDLTKEIEDVQELLIVTDILISDYSSIVTDFSITKRPVIYYMFDHQLYLEKCRSMFDDVEDVLPGPFVYDENELLRYIDDLSWQNEPDTEMKIQKFKDKFHKYFDGNSSKRIFDEIKKLNCNVE